MITKNNQEFQSTDTQNSIPARDDTSSSLVEQLQKSSNINPTSTDKKADDVEHDEYND